MTEHLLQFLFNSEIPSETTSFIDPRGNMIRNFSRKELQEAVTTFASGMAVTDVRPGKRVAIIARTSFTSLVACLGNLLNGCANVVIPITATSEEQQHALAQSRAETLIVEDMETAKIVMEQVMFLPSLRQIVILNQSGYEPHPSLLTFSWDDLMQRGKKKMLNTQERLQAISGEDESYIFFLRNNFHQFQSLTLTHKDMVNQINSSEENYHVSERTTQNPQENKVLSVLPFYRPFSHIVGFFLPLKFGLPMMAVDREDGWKSGSLPIKPRFLISESLLVEDTIEELKNFMLESGGLSQRVIKMAIAWTDRIGAGESQPFSIARIFFQPILKRRIQERFGGKLEYIMLIDDTMDYKARSLYVAAKLPLSRCHMDAQGLQEDTNDPFAPAIAA